MARSGLVVKGGSYDMDRAAVSDIVKTQAVQSLLEEAANRLCSEANTIELNREGHAGYKTAVHVLDRTAISEVYTATDSAARDNAKYHTLNSINH